MIKKASHVLKVIAMLAITLLSTGYGCEETLEVEECTLPPGKVCCRTRLTYGDTNPVPEIHSKKDCEEKLHGEMDCERCK